jgi:hypothetical protein
VEVGHVDDDAGVGSRGPTTDSEVVLLQLGEAAGVIAIEAALRP